MTGTQRAGCGVFPGVSCIQTAEPGRAWSLHRHVKGKEGCYATIVPSVLSFSVISTQRHQAIFTASVVGVSTV